VLESALVRRYRELRGATGCLREVGDLTAREHVARLDPEGVLDLAAKLGEAKAAELLRSALLDVNGRAKL
jgi:hypothetical protein